MKPLYCLEMSETKYLVMQLLIPEEQIPHSHYYRKVNGVLLVVTINFGFSVKGKRWVM
jgi:ATP-dependent phosphoenolpyruvate carboxykinase